MPNQARQEKISRFEDFNFSPRDSGRSAPKFHDNDVRSIEIQPASGKGGTTTVKMIFFDREEKVERIVCLKNCVNIRFSLDLDILVANSSSATDSAGQTSNVEINDCNDCISRLIKQGMADWNVEYPPNKDTPASYKLWRLNEFILIKVLLHGGILEIVCRDFELDTVAA